MITGSAETVQQAVQSGAEIAARMTEYSAANINVIVKSNVELVELARIMSRNWMCFAQEGIERGFDWFKMSAAIPRGEYFTNFQEEAVRASLDAFLRYAQRDESVRMTDELTRTTVTELTIQRM